jgi:NhaP-type Na+/H+ or K+/H+ antiporter
MESADIALALTAIGLLGVACQWVAWRTRLPAILYLLLGGVIAGPVLGWLDSDALLGDLLFPFVSLAVAVILFEGSLTLRLEEIKGLSGVVRRLVGLGSLISATVATLAARWLVGLDWPIAVLFGALMVVTGPTVVVPMLRTVRPTAKVANILRWEGIVIDPLGALLVVLVYEFIVSSTGALSGTLLAFAEIVAAGLAVGTGGGWLLGLILRRHWVPDFLVNVVSLNAVLVVFVGANTLAHEAGLLAVTVMGMLLANLRGIPTREILHFKESLSVLLISALFILLAARVDLASVERLGWAALGVLGAIQLIGRPLKVAFATAGSGLSWRERVMVAWIGPRGIVAAAIAAVFTIRLGPASFDQAELIVPLVFSIIVGTVLLQGLTAGLLARRLGVAEPEPKGFLLVGADPVARAIGRALQERDLPVVLADDNWHGVRAANMQGLRTFYGNPVSEYADRALDLVGIGHMMAVSPDPYRNALAVLRYRPELGREHVYTLRVAPEQMGADKRRVGPEHTGRLLFGPQASHHQMAKSLTAGGEIRATRLTEKYGFDDLMHDSGAKALPLFAIDPKDRLRVFAQGEELEPGSGWTLLCLHPSEKASDQARGATAEEPDTEVDT